jgi:hypothetical protein
MAVRAQDGTGLLQSSYDLSLSLFDKLELDMCSQPGYLIISFTFNMLQLAKKTGE